MQNHLKKVLVTGASGYIASHCIRVLLEKGFKVKGSVRDLKKLDIKKKFLDDSLNKDNIEFCELNLLSDRGWNSAIKDCDYLMHIASPCVIKEPKNEIEIIKPAVEGTLRALNYANNSNIKKVILTSSIGAMLYGNQKKYCKSSDWTDVSEYVGSYIKSKTLSEKAAWNFFNNLSNPSFSLTTINPGMVFGPVINGNLEGTSQKMILNLIRGQYPVLPEIYFSVVDVRDVAKIHVEALLKIESDNLRLVVTSEKSVSFLNISKTLKKIGFSKCPTKLIPSSLIKVLALFNKDMRLTSMMIKKGSFEVDISKTISIFNWTPIPLEKTLLDMTESF
tara:strand:- start:118 stop:1119 length:1002 start_codon:yes stop_codon:yes gene_type:complete